MAGNHDEWLCPFYEAELGATIIAEPHDMTVHGLRLRFVHGHLLGARRAWKAWMEGRAFFEAFAYVPGPFAQDARSNPGVAQPARARRRRRAPPARLSQVRRTTSEARPISWSSAMSTARSTWLK